MFLRKSTQNTRGKYLANIMPKIKKLKEIRKSITAPLTNEDNYFSRYLKVKNTQDQVLKSLLKVSHVHAYTS